jgi:hypothetical protein
MNSILRAASGLFGCFVLFAAGCAQTARDSSFTLRQIDSAPSGNGPVRVVLTTPDETAKADARVVVAFMKIVAVHVATQRQRQIAEARARAAFRKTPGKARYFAVVTEKSAAAPGQKAATSVMIWDTQAETMVANKVYDVESTPRIGTVARFETFSAEYIGDGTTM